jgi:hypothetical protein
MTDAPQILLAHHLKTLKLPTFLREHEKQARSGGGRRQNSRLRASARGAPPRGWITSSSCPGWSNWSCPAACAANT